MVNLTYVRPLVGRQGILKKFSFAVTCFYSLGKGDFLKLKRIKNK